MLAVPKDITRNTDPGQSTAFVSDATIGTAIATDNVPGVTVIRSGVPTGNVFPIGVTVITWTATDVFNNTTIGTQIVTIVDAEKPVLVVPPNVSREIPTGQTSIPLTEAELGTATASDNSGSVTVTSSGVPDGLVFPLGTTTITWTATDPSGNVTTGLQTVTVTTPLPAVTVVATDASGSEAGPDPITFVVSRSMGESPLTVALTWSGEAVYGVDYNVTAAGGVLFPTGAGLTFDAGSASVTLTVTPIDDVIAESAESVLLAVAAGSGYAVGVPAGAVAQIISDDAAPPTSTVGVLVTDGSGSEPSDPVAFTIGRVGATSTEVVIRLAWSGTATLGVDYTVSGTGLSADGRSLTLAAGVDSAVVTVTPVDDTLVEPTESVVLTVLSGTGYELGAQTSVSGTIADNDVAPALPTVTIVATDPTGAETRTGAPLDTVTLTLSRTGDLSKALVVGFGWFGTAKLGRDFTAAVVGAGALSKTTVTFGAGQETLTIQIRPIDDATVEALETVIMTLKSGTAYTLGAAMSATGTIADNDDAAASATTAPTTASAPSSDDTAPVATTPAVAPEASTSLVSPAVALTAVDGGTTVALDTTTTSGESSAPAPDGELETEPAGRPPGRKD